MSRQNPGRTFNMKRFVTSIAAGAMMVGSLTVFASTVASAAGVLTATPNTGLTNGQVIKVSGSGFVPNESVYVIECLASATSAASCDINSVVPAKTDANGVLPPTNFKVATGIISGTTTCGTSSSDLNNCIVSVGTSFGADTAATPVTFAAPTSTTTTPKPKPSGPRHVIVKPSISLHNGQNVRVSGSGFKPHDHVYVVECLATVRSSAQCNLATLKPETITGGGLLPALTFKVRTGKIGTGTCGTKAANLKSCVISVGNAAKGDAAIAHIAFVLKK
jgi:hypothetical protein